MNKTLNLLREGAYFSFNKLVKYLGGYQRFERVYRLAKILGAVRSRVGYVGGASREDYLDAVKKSFPGKDAHWYDAVIKEFWTYHEMIFLDLFLLDAINSGNIDRLVEFEGLQYLDQAMKTGKGAIMPVPHIGNVRMLHYALALKGYPLTVVSSGYSDDPDIVRKFKLKMTSSVHEVGFRGEYPRWILDSLKENRVIQIASTAEAGKVGAEVKFLNRNLYLTSGWARLAYLSDSTVLPAYILRKPDYRHLVHISPPFDMSKSGGKRNRVQKSIERLMNEYESVYQANPAQIDWMSWMVRLREAKERGLI